VFSKTVTAGQYHKQTMIFLSTALFKLKAKMNNLKRELGEAIQCEYK
jgi:hypothetical protein